MTYAYYNDTDPYVCAWVRNLIKAKLITDGEVDERPIQDVRPIDLKPFTRAHFFCGIAGWELALRQSNWPADRKVWTGSCPCQPFSTAGKRLQFNDERHLWPFWFHLIGVCRPPTVFGEQVANGAGPWLDLVFTDLESANYAVGAAVLPAAGVGAPHIRDRAWFVAHSGRSCGDEVWAAPGTNKPNSIIHDQRCGSHVANANAPGRQDAPWIPAAETKSDGGPASCLGSGQAFSDADREPVGRSPVARQERGFWQVEPDVGRVAYGIPNASHQLRAYGNAIVPQVAAEFINATIFPQPS